MPDQTVQTPNEPGGLTGRPVIDVALQRLTPDQVHVKDLSTVGDDREVLRDLVELQLGTGEHGVKVSVLGTLEEILDVLNMAVGELRRVNMDREAAGR